MNTSSATLLATAILSLLVSEHTLGSVVLVILIGASFICQELAGIRELLTHKQD